MRFSWLAPRKSARSDRIPPIVWLGAALALGLLHLWLTIGPQIIAASDPFWRYPPRDFAIHVLGAEALLRDPQWHFPLAVTSRLVSGGQQVSILFTDSAPWVAIIVKALGADQISVIGLVAALSVVLQPVAFMLLLLALGVRRAESLLVGAILGSLLPAWYMRLGMHVALSSHWLIVLALALSVTAIRKGVSWRIIGGLAVLGALSFGIHLYLFVMIAAIALAALLADVARSGRTAAPRALAGLTLFLMCSALTAWMLVHGPTGGAGGFGSFSMNLLSPFFPQQSGLAQLILGRPGDIIDATTGQYEGFNYLGAGALICIAVAALAFYRSKPPRDDRRAAFPLIIVLLALAVFSLSNIVFLGYRPILYLPAPDFLGGVLGALRSSGRMFWPAAYMLIAWSIMMLDRFPNRKLAGSTLVLALALQIVDTSVMRQTLQNTYRPKAPLALNMQPLAGLASLRFVPAYSCTEVDRPAMRQLALAVERNGAVVEDGPIGRFDPAICERSAIERELADSAPGHWDLLIVKALPAEVVESAKHTSRCTTVGEDLLCERLDG
jgi:hypothetical protein